MEPDLIVVCSTVRNCHHAHCSPFLLHFFSFSKAQIARLPVLDSLNFAEASLSLGKNLYYLVRNHNKQLIACEQNEIAGISDNLFAKTLSYPQLNNTLVLCSSCLELDGSWLFTASLPWEIPAPNSLPYILHYSPNLVFHLVHYFLCCWDPSYKYSIFSHLIEDLGICFSLMRCSMVCLLMCKFAAFPILLRWVLFQQTFCIGRKVIFLPIKEAVGEYCSSLNKINRFVQNSQFQKQNVQKSPPDHIELSPHLAVLFWWESNLKVNPVIQKQLEEIWECSCFETGVFNPECL